jgi:hypothetical protein
MIPFNNGQRQRKTKPNQLRSPLSYQPPHRMNIKERRQRIAICNQMSVHDVYMLEQQMILWQIQDALQNNHQIMIHSLHFQDNNDTNDTNHDTNIDNIHDTHDHDNNNSTYY